ncbi:hypothetical protein HMN09_00873300 [Mycena chlorophos]|uniref:Transmembrane protein n=1 Tax=Mycena chlorophos TaxID=658473 RepID=A0A8H6SPK1_MYCCL|nr:hypothetical protein HMN09_00873300 [Mycena chlorophos]
MSFLPVTSAVQVLPGVPAGTIFSSSTSVFTSTSAVPTVVNGITTTVEEVFTSTSIALVPIGTAGSTQAGSNSSTVSNNSSGSIGVTVGYVFLLVAIACVAALPAWWRLRQLRAKAAKMEAEDALAEQLENQQDAEVLPFTAQPWPRELEQHEARTALSHSSTVRTVRQQLIATQMHQAREKVAELAAEVRSTRSASVTSEGDPQLPTTQDDRLADALQQIERLNARIQELERHGRSSWALGETDIPPPGYDEVF